MKKGFTLVEVLVSISIISILSTVGVQTFYTSQKVSRLNEDISKVVLAIRQAQNASLAPSRNETGVSDSEKLCSIGVKVIQSSNSIQPFYTTLSSGNNCSTSKINYGILTNLSYSEIDSNIDFEFVIPFATTGSNSVKLRLNDLEKEIQVTSSGLIKVQ